MHRATDLAPTSLEDPSRPCKGNTPDYRVGLGDLADTIHITTSKQRMPWLSKITRRRNFVVLLGLSPTLGRHMVWAVGRLADMYAGLQQACSGMLWEGLRVPESDPGVGERTWPGPRFRAGR